MLESFICTSIIHKYLFASQRAANHALPALQREPFCSWQLFDSDHIEESRLTTHDKLREND